MRLPIILDPDPGIDDAAAIAAALFAPQLDLQLMTTVAGNVSVEKTTRNALQLLHFWNADVPLAQGSAKPLLRSLRDAAYVHGESGMEGYDFVEHDRQPLAKPAFIALRDALMSAPEPITLVAIGPLTNIALLLMHYPECTFNIRRLVIMGGSAGRGNFTPNAEFNIAVDPEAAARVFQSGIEIVMWAGCHKPGDADAGLSGLAADPQSHWKDVTCLVQPLSQRDNAHRRADARSLRDCLAGASGTLYAQAVFRRS